MVGGHTADLYLVHSYGSLHPQLTRFCVVSKSRSNQHKLDDSAVKGVADVLRWHTIESADLDRGKDELRVCRLTSRGPIQDLGLGIDLETYFMRDFAKITNVVLSY